MTGHTPPYLLDFIFGGLIFAGITGIFALGVANVAGWYDLRDKYPSRHLPWNWRVLIGPRAYLKWLQRRGTRDAVEIGEEQS